jgi:hypothetical protein
VTDRGSDGEKLPQVWKEGSPENCHEGQTLPLREVPQTKPETREDSRPLVLPGLPQGEQRLDHHRE